MSDRNILLVGAAGYIGSHTNKILYRNGCKTVVLDDLSRGHRSLVKWGEFVRGDMGDGSLVEGILKKHSIDLVMHFSAFAYVGESCEQPQMYYENNVAKTIKLLNAMLRSGVRKLVFSSSCAVYGEPATLPINEEHPLKPINPYGNTKMMIEKILTDYDKYCGLKYISLRYFNAAGADPGGEIGEMHNPETHLIPLVIDTALGKRDYIEIFGHDFDTDDGTCVRDYVHVMDIADAHQRAADWLLNMNDSETFNLGTGSGVSINEIVDACERITGKKISVRRGKRRQGDPAVLVSDSNMIHKKMGWTPQLSDINRIIETAWRWHGKR